MGLGLGLVMQVLVVAVQNAVPYELLGVATSGATLFRLIGGALGTALLGTLFNDGLDDRIAANLPAGPETDQLMSGALDPARIEHLPPGLRSSYVDAFSGALDHVFVVGACIALAGFVLAWFLEERPLRETVATAGIGEGLAMPKSHRSLNEIERGLWNLMSRDAKRAVLARIIDRAGVDLTPVDAWLLARAGEVGRVDVHALAEEYAIPINFLDASAVELTVRGLIGAGDAGLALTSSGDEMLERLYRARREGLEEMLDGWSPEQHDELGTLLTRLSRTLSAEVPTG